MKKLIAALVLAMGLGTAVSSTPAAAQEAFIGEIRFFGGNFAPRSWAFCDGQLMAIAENTALFSILGTIYGGDGRTTFGLPDMRGRVMIHKGTGPGLSTYREGQKGGTEQIFQTLAQLANHSHLGKIRAANAASGSTDVAGAVMANGGAYLGRGTPNADMAANTVQTDATGGGQGMNIIQPFVTTNCIIALFGVYPSRS